MNGVSGSGLSGREMRRLISTHYSRSWPARRWRNTLAFGGFVSLLVAGCAAKAADPPSAAPTASSDLIAACRRLADTQPRPELTYDQAVAIAGQEVTACQIPIAPAQGESVVLTIPADVTAEPRFAAGAAMNRPRPSGCDTVARSTVLFLVVDGSLVEARQCGTSSQS